MLEMKKTSQLYTCMHIEVTNIVIFFLPDGDRLLSPVLSSLIGSYIMFG